MTKIYIPSKLTLLLSKDLFQNLLEISSDPATGEATVEYVQDQLLKFDGVHTLIPEELRMPDHRPLGYPRIVKEFNRETNTATLTLADAVATTIFNWNHRALIQILGPPRYRFTCTAPGPPDGDFPCTLIIEREARRITVGALILLLLSAQP